MKRLSQKSQRIAQPKLDKKLIEEISKILEEYVTKEIFGDLPPLHDAENANDSKLVKALKSGDLTFHMGVFSGKLNASISRELSELGAVFKDGYFRINKDELPDSVIKAIEVSGVKFEKKLDKIEKILNDKLDSLKKDDPKIELFQNIKDLLFAYDSSLDSKLKAIGVEEELDEVKLEKIAENYERNMKRYIKDIVEEEIKELRANVRELYLSGGREKQLVEIVKKRLGVSQRRAKFIANQEMNLMASSYQKEKMVDAGSWGYEWRARADARPMHKVLDKQIFTWENPPITNPSGDHNHPGEDYNCYCIAVALF